MIQCCFILPNAVVEGEYLTIAIAAHGPFIYIATPK
jgi:hypothetical protein